MTDAPAQKTTSIDDRVLLLYAGMAGALFGVGVILLVQGEIASGIPPLIIFVVSLLWISQLRKQVAAPPDAAD